MLIAGLVWQKNFYKMYLHTMCKFLMTMLIALAVFARFKKLRELTGSFLRAISNDMGTLAANASSKESVPIVLARDICLYLGNDSWFDAWPRLF